MRTSGGQALPSDRTCAASFLAIAAASSGRAPQELRGIPVASFYHILFLIAGPPNEVQAARRRSLYAGP